MLVRVALAYSLGIAMAANLPIQSELLLLPFVVFLLIAVFSFVRGLNALPIIIILFFLAGALALRVSQLPDPKNIANLPSDRFYSLSGLVAAPPACAEGKLSFPLTVEKEGSREAHGQVRVSVPAGAWVEYGDRVSVRGRLNVFNGLGFLFSNELEVLEKGRGNPLGKLCFWISAKFNEGLQRILPRKEASLLGSFLLGSLVSPLDTETKDKYRRAGLIHLLVVSGTQVSILIGVCLALTRAAGLSLLPSVIATSFFNLVLVVLTGAGASIVRAAIMGEITLLGLLTERSKDIYVSLAASALILLLFDPQVLFDIGFQLSFAATWALVYIAPALAKKMPNLLAISLGPLLATSPIILFNFGQVTPGAFISNFLVLPWVEFLVILGLLATLLGFIALPLAKILGATIWLALNLLDAVAEAVASLPGGSFYVKAPGLVTIVFYYLGLMALVKMIQNGNKFSLSKRGIIFGGLSVLTMLLWVYILFSGPAAQKLTVTFLDVGQGDCALIETPGGKKILIDGGGVDQMEDLKKPAASGQTKNDRVGEKIVLPFLRKNGINKLDLVILTHPHADHLGGLNVILAKIQTERVIDNGQVYNSAAYRRFRALIRANRIKYSKTEAGDRIRFDQDLIAEVLGPTQPFFGSPNNDSIVLKMRYKNISFLFTGDVEKEGEERMIRALSRADILKVSHHGSSTSTTDDFLSRVRPKLTVISVGERNRYRHPSQKTIERMKKMGAYVTRTDCDGAIEIKTTGRGYSISRSK